MSRARTFFKAVAWLLVLAALALAGAAWWGWTQHRKFVEQPLAIAGDDRSIMIERGDSFNRVLGKLREAGIDEGHDLEWQWLARRIDAAGRLHVGEYALEPGLTPVQLLSRMRDGQVVRHRFTILDGWNIRDLRAALARNEVLQQQVPELDDGALMDALGLPGVHPEGRFLPETYLFTRGDSDLDVLRRANAALERVLEDAWASRADDLQLSSQDEALIMASIIEKETGAPEERREISGVFNRRLALGMRLQTDPTVIYGIGSSFDGNIRRSDLLTDTPYNTYTRGGLPPTPIAMAGAAAIRAAVDPAPGDTLYFVAVGDGSGRHVFSRTYAEHNVAVREYVRRYRERFGGPSP